MKTADKHFQLKISAVDFVVAPQQICIKSTETQQYLIQFDKGAQILKKFQEQIHIHPQKNAYIFSSMEQGRFKLQNERACACEWGLYRSAGKEMSEFVDSLPVNLLEHYTLFATSLKNCQADYLRLVAQHAQGKDVSRLWDSIKERCQWEFKNLVAKNRSNTIELRYRLQIRCEADGWAQAEKRKSTKSLKSIRSIPDKQNNSFSKANHDEDDLLPKNSSICQQIAEMPERHLKQANHHVHFKMEQQVNQEEKIRINEPPLIQISKKGSVLSDILERSQQQSTHFNEKQNRNELKQISDIPQEENELPSPYLSTLSNVRAQNFEAMGSIQEDAFKRRCTTFGSNHSEFPQQIEMEGRRMSVPQRHYMHRDEYSGKEQLQQGIETLPHSEVSPPHQQKAQLMSEINRGGRAKYVIVFFFSLIFIGALAFQAHFQQQSTATPPKKVLNKPRKVQQRRRKKSKE